MSSSGNKTPVSILNEYLIQKGEPARYDLMFNGSGSENPVFVYAVRYNDLTALGRGRSKQEAKHEAAKQMLEQLNISSEVSQSDVNELVLPHENNIGYNAVGVLNDYCIRQFYPEAVYSVVSENGPPHAKIFTIQCCVSRLSTVGVARTKKQAKQIAAHKMVMQLQDEAGERPMAIALTKKVPVPESSNSGMKPVNVHKPQGLLYKDFCNAYLDLPDRSETLSEFLKKKDSLDESEDAFETLQKIAEELAVDLIVEKLNEEGGIEVINSIKDISESTITQIPEILLPDSEDIFLSKSEEKLLPKSEEINEDYHSETDDYEDCFEYCASKSSNNDAKKSDISSTEPLIAMSLMVNPPVVSLGLNITEAAVQLLGYLNILCV